MFVPGEAVAGPVLVTARSAWLVIVVFTVPVLLAEFDSAVVVVPVAELVSTVPLAMAASLVETVIVAVAVAPEATVPKVNVITLPLTLTPPPGGTLAPWIVSSPGTVSVTTTFWASLGPLLVTAIV